MNKLATVFYEDKMQPDPSGDFPIHSLMLRLIADGFPPQLPPEIWIFKKQLAGVSKRGVDNILTDLRDCFELISAGLPVFILIDRDKIIDHVNKNFKLVPLLTSSSTDEQIKAQIQKGSGKPSSVNVFFLYPNMEGLLQSIRRCNPTLLPDVMNKALQKKVNDRDIILKELSKESNLSLRTCVLQAQPELSALVCALTALLQRTNP
jgi:hypothetical protein